MTLYIVCTTSMLYDILIYIKNPVSQITTNSGHIKFDVIRKSKK